MLTVFLLSFLSLIQHALCHPDHCPPGLAAGLTTIQAVTFQTPADIHEMLFPQRFPLYHTEAGVHLTKDRGKFNSLGKKCVNGAGHFVASLTDSPKYVTSSTATPDATQENKLNTKPAVVS